MEISSAYNVSIPFVQFWPIRNQYIIPDIITTISKNSKECSLSIRPDDLLFVIRDESKRCLPLIWAELKKDAVFAEYSFRGVSDLYNEIVLVLNPSFLARALGPVRAFETIKLKLVKIQENSYLSVDILVVSLVSSLSEANAQ